MISSLATLDQMASCLAMRPGVWKWLNLPKNATSEKSNIDTKDDVFLNVSPASNMAI